MSRYISLIGLLWLVLNWIPSGIAQEDDSLVNPGIYLQVGAHDTIPHFLLKEVQVFGKSRHRRGKYYRQTRKYWRTVRNIRIVYPYAQLANERILDINSKLVSLEKRKERRRLIRDQYKDLMKEYRAPLMRLRISQGKLLMKLIDRETGNTSYQHLKELKGGVNALFWQSVALMFGSNLKSHYDPQGDDWMVEEILERMKKGELAPPRNFVY